VGYHSAGILRYAKDFFPHAEVVGIVDESLERLDEERRELIDKQQCCRYPVPSRDTDVFVQLSPMTHDPSVMAPLLGRSGVVTCSVVYDFIPLADPDQYLPSPELHRAFLNRLAWLKLYDRFCPISEYSGRELGKLLGVGRHTIHVTGACVRDTFMEFHPEDHEQATPACRWLPRNYFLFVGGGHPRKNADVVVRAHANLARRSGSDVGLVIVGHYEKQSEEQLHWLFRHVAQRGSQIEFVQGISDTQLGILYHHALATICPSRIEGFSLPVVEALACGCPVIASNCAAQAELMPDEAALFDPDDCQRLSQLMGSMLDGAICREALLAQQEPVVPRFGERRVAAEFWGTVRSAWKRRSPTRRTVVGGQKPRLAFLTPYPPDRSGVAEYTAHSFRSLAMHAEIDVFTDAKIEKPDPSVRQFQPLSELPYLVNDYDRVVSVVGNSQFHTRIIDYHCRYGGACVEHDNRLAELYAWWRGPQAFAEMASRSLRRPVSVEESQSWLANPGRLPSVFFDEIIPMADPLIVHSRGIQQNLMRQYGAPAQYLPFCCYNHFPREELSDEARAAARKRLGLSPDRVVIVSFGIVAAVKGAEECVWAIEQLHAWNIKADLHFVGAVDEGFQKQLSRLSHRLGVNDHVHLSDDWIPDQTYRDFVVAADYAIQLRTHGFGGLSGAVLDCISAGLATVVNQDLAHAMNAPEYVLRVPDHLSPVLIAEQIATGVESGLHRRRMRPQREEYLREYNFENYAAGMMQVLGLS
jgi:glycosyltransferase involved in cell wall biosynthesis